MKNYADNIFVAIIRSNSEFCDFSLLGRPLSDYVYKGIGVLAHGTFERERDIKLPKNFEYLAVIYADMPLVTAESLINAVELMDKKNLPRVEIGKGFLTSEPNNLSADSALTLNFTDFLSVFDTRTLRLVYNELRKRIIERHALGGAIILGDPVIDDTAVVHSGAIIEGRAEIVGDSEICAGARVRSSRIENSKVCENATIGPYSYVRLNSVIGAGARIGDFVEVKKSILGDGVKSAHLTYIGDAEVGAKTNVGCGTVFCNYDGKNKHKTVIGEGVFIGANTNLIAPLNVADGAFIAAGTTVTNDIEKDNFCIGRVKQSSRPKRK